MGTSLYHRYQMGSIEVWNEFFLCLPVTGDRKSNSDKGTETGLKLKSQTLHWLLITCTH